MVACKGCPCCKLLLNCVSLIRRVGVSSASLGIQPLLFCPLSVSCFSSRRGSLWSVDKGNTQTGIRLFRSGALLHLLIDFPLTQITNVLIDPEQTEPIFLWTIWRGGSLQRVSVQTDWKCIISVFNLCGSGPEMSAFSSRTLHWSLFYTQDLALISANTLRLDRTMLTLRCSYSERSNLPVS